MSQSPILDGPFYEEFTDGMIVAPLPDVTLTDADNVAYRMIVGDQHLATADRTLHERISGSSGSLAHPGLVVQFSIGQTTNATRRAIANLYYRSVRVLQPVEVGATLQTTTRVLGLSDARSKGDHHRGKVWLGIETRADGELVVTYERCALVAGRTPPPGHSCDIPGPAAPDSLDTFLRLVPGWDLSHLPHTEWTVGEERADPMRDHIDLAPSFARMIFNQAFVHRDATAAVSGQRLVFGGHTQGLAQASLTRLLPGLATVLGWDGCDHLGPVFEGDLLEFRHLLVAEHTIDDGRVMRFETRARREGEQGRRFTSLDTDHPRSVTRQPTEMARTSHRHYPRAP